MQTGFTAILDADGGVEFRVYGRRSTGGPPPLVAVAQDEEAHTAVLVIGALMYHEEIGVRPFDSAGGPDASDAALALAAYRRGGVAALERLEGEFVLVLWDGMAKRLLALRDPLGSWPLFWQAHGSATAVSTSLEALVRLQPRRSFDEEYLADFLMWPNPHAELPTERTAFEGIRRILPGAIVEFSPGGAPRERRYWDWESRIQASPGITGDEAAQTSGLLFRRAVRERLRRGPPAAHLSGGMDSSAVACVARDLLASCGGPALVTLSLVYNRPSLAGEREYIDLVLKQGGSVVPCFIAGETAADYDWFRTGLPFHDEPYAGLPGAGSDQPLIEAAERQGAATILSGMGSDELFASSPFQIADSLQQGRWLTACRQSRAWSRARNRGFWSTFRRYGLELAWPKVWGREGKWPRLGWYGVPPWVGADFARKHRMVERGRGHARRLSGAPVSQVFQRNMLLTGAGDWSRWHLTGPRGLNYSHPFKDPRLVCFALGLPPEIRSNPDDRKPVLREALRGVLPEAIRTRREKRGFDDIYGLGLVRNLAYLESMVQASALRSLGLLDSDRLIPVIRDAALGIGDIRARERMDKTLALVAWFDQYQRGSLPALPIGERIVIGGRSHETQLAAPGAFKG